ncbi:hypothetical protein E5161_18995 [Cohnella pontilimi]|uniref:Lipoprotein n=1 Tax=Cohnella pontilimi TaxID=2564100 RepID=A0A4U0F365_9BACL|nr:hypothetical protein [Cohnella pontilimi]TJY38923.1 hypothetical protein E5161_18995 [Cohnella pontilimi]
MVKSKVWLSTISLMLTAALLLAGCNSNKSPKEALQSSMTKSAEMKSYSFQGSMKVEDLKIPTAEGEDPAATGMIMSMLKSADISWTGAYRADPMQVEMKLNVALKGDMSINVNVPLVMTKDKMWFKIPNTPFFPVPEKLKDKFVEVDLKKLAEESGQPLPNLDPGKSQQMANDMLGIVFKHVDEKQYLSDVKAKDAGLPQDADVKQVIQFKLTKDQVEPFLKMVIEKIAPEVIDLFSKNEEYRKLLQLKPEDLDAAKKQLETAKGEDLSKSMEEFKKTVKSLEVVSNIGIDKKDYPAYTDIRAKADFDVAGQTGTAAIKVVSEMKDINKDVKLEYPDGPKDSVSMDEFQQEMDTAFGGSGL